MSTRKAKTIDGLTGPRKMTGSCLCGEVSFSANVRSGSIGACHCNNCRNWSGGPVLEIECGTDVTFEGHEKISTFSSSEWAERGFCNVCGTHLFIRVKAENVLGLPAGYGIPPGLFHDQNNLDLDLEVFIDQKPSYYEFVNETRQVTSADVYKKHPLARG